jgi:UDP-N-acetyl-D-galactosamine dehydrogenase
MKTEMDIQIAVIGLGYVGLPLAAAFSEAYPVVGFDIDPRRIAELEAGHDRTEELSAEELATAAAEGIRFSADLEALKGCNVFVVTVPTPIDGHRRPDLTPLIKASEIVGAAIQPGAVVIYESTVYPGRPRKTAFRWWRRSQASSMAKIFTPAIAQSASTRAIRPIG